MGLDVLSTITRVITNGPAITSGSTISTGITTCLAITNSSTIPTGVTTYPVFTSVSTIPIGTTTCSVITIGFGCPIMRAYSIGPTKGSASRTKAIATVGCAASDTCLQGPIYNCYTFCYTGCKQVIFM